ncbi:MAG TPA: ATP-binding protein [Polyangiaceae bacterium]|nr:ATP-binding protein [Polyangiaceae bacterium]
MRSTDGFSQLSKRGRGPRSDSGDPALVIPNKLALRTSLIYGAVGALWILCSDALVAAIFREREAITRVSMYKGWAFVVVTALALYTGLRGQLEQLKAEHRRRELAEAERRRGEHEIARLSRVYATLSRINECVARARDRTALFEQVCSIATGEAEYKLAFVAWAATPSSRLSMQALSGECEHFLDMNEVLNSNPIVDAFENGRRAIAELNLQSSAACEGCMKCAGLRSAAAFPIRVRGEVHGVFAACASEAGAFGASELELLERAIDNVCFGLEMLDREERRARAERALQSNEDRLRRMADSVPAGLVILSGLRFDFVNDHARKLLGAADQQALDGHSIAEYLHTDDQSAFSQAIDELLARGTPSSFSELRLLRADGVVVLAEVSAVPFDAGGDPTTLVFFRDIGKQRLLEQQLRQSQKMEAIGTLAGGVAHDFNNLLTVILANASLLLPALEQDASNRDLVQEITETGTRAAELTRQLLLFSRRQALRSTEFDVNDVVANLSKLLRRILGEDVAFCVECCPGLPAVRGDVTMFEQVIMNLAVNARDAMQDGGKLTISTRTEQSARPATPMQPYPKPMPCVVISVSDTGTGIGADILPHIFEPFFTTKDVGQGTGLGLATAYGIVDQHHGWIAVDTRVGTGTTFHVYFPAVSVRQPSPPVEDRARGLAGGKETLLVVEDDPAVRRAIVGVLRHCGYTVLEAASGPDALALWAQRQTDIKLLITDCIMPLGINGLDLADRLRHDEPSLPVLYTSGYRAMGIDSSRLELGVNFLEKPFEANALAVLVRKQLDVSVI